MIGAWRTHLWGNCRPSRAWESWHSPSIYMVAPGCERTPLRGFIRKPTSPWRVYQGLSPLAMNGCPSGAGTGNVVAQYPGLSRLARL